MGARESGRLYSRENCQIDGTSARSGHMTASPAEASMAPRTGRPLIVVEGVHKVFANGTAALDAVSLTMPGQAQFLALLGPSGCGKSTLLRIIAGLESPTAGRIEWPTTVHDAHGRPLPELAFV